eukprot:scaffold3436_cov32-Tisochrysis_lutea.AAC.2
MHTGRNLLPSFAAQPGPDELREGTGRTRGRLTHRRRHGRQRTGGRTSICRTFTVNIESAEAARPQ